jgi:hypothetical protein
VDSIGGNVVQNLQPVRPFWMRIAVKEDLGKVIAWRARDEKWSVTHPWFSERLPGPLPPDAAPYFRAPGGTHVGSAIEEEQALRQNLKDAATEWLRKALVQELAWSQVHLRALSSDALAALRTRLPPTQRDQFDRLQAADSFLPFCDAMPIDGLIGLTRAVVDAGLDVPPLSPLAPVASSAVAEEEGLGPLSRLRSSLELLPRLHSALASLPRDRRAALELTLRPAQRSELERFSSAANQETYCAQTDDQTQAALFLALTKGLDDWAYHPERLQRLTHVEAKRTIEALDEVQLVVESILSDEWENWGNPRRYRGAKPKPEQSMPLGSVYGDSAALKTQREGFEKEYGLQRFEDAWWYLDPKKPEGAGRSQP